MSKELIIVTGLPYSGRTTWLSQKYSGEGTIIIDETSYEKMFKDGKYQESEFIPSLDWVASQVNTHMTNSVQRIVVSLLQSRPDHWVALLELAKTHEYSFTPVKPHNGYLYYSTNKFARNQDQIDWIQKSTMKRFTKQSKDKKKKTEDDEEKENPNLYQNLVTECQSAYAFLLQNRDVGTDVNKWLDIITKQFKPVIIRGQQLKVEREKKLAKEAEKVAREAAKLAEKAAREAAKQADKVQTEQSEQSEQTEKKIEVEQEVITNQVEVSA